MGTPYCMAPEQVTAKDATYLADIYSFGILPFELLTGQRPICMDPYTSMRSKIHCCGAKGIPAP
jgi:serine/threonine protein kinase